MNKTNVLLVSGSLVVGIGIGVAFVFSWFTVGPPNLLLLPCDHSTLTGDCAMLPSSSPVATSTPETILTPEQSGKIDEHLFIDLALRDVKFCGKTYKVKQVIIDGVDVVQRIAELATKNLIIEKYSGAKKAICENIKNNMSLNTTEIEVSSVIPFSNQYEHKAYAVFISDMWFGFDIETNDIYTASGFDGSLIGPIGKLK